ncbi:MAG: copper homeostasis protein CutC [Balneolaceae bacterium]|nr:copper homeostasis protein CutC [Balneolaceae bacterium]
MPITFEAPVFNVKSALKAADAGVDRLELCSSFAEGGETPGAGMLSWIKSRVSIPVFAMIRPRGGDYAYSSDEIKVMGEEMEKLGNAGADGFVFGILNSDNRIHVAACRELVEQAGDKPCTFHRAFDACKDPEVSLEQIIECGFKRVLTSGLKESIDEGLDEVIRLLIHANSRIVILPGGGLKPEHLPTLMETGYLQEVHASCKRWNNGSKIPIFEPGLFLKFRRQMNR